MILSTKVENVLEQFRKLPKKGKLKKFWHLPYYSNLAFEHVQGYTQTYDDEGKEYYIFTHNSSNNQGYIIIKNGIDSKEYKEIKLPSGWVHPGSIQALGNYVFVPCEKNNETMLFVYDVKNPDREPCYSCKFNHSASSVGITDFKYADMPCYMMIINKNPECYIYISSIPEDGDMSKLDFEPEENFGKFNLKEKCEDSEDFEGLGLITGTDDKVYALILGNHAVGLKDAPVDYKDYAYLLEVSLKDGDKLTVTTLDKKKVECSGLTLSAGVHFRFGAGMCIQKDEYGKGRICMLASARNIIGGFGNSLETNIWQNSTLKN